MTTHHGKYGEGRTRHPPQLADSRWFGGKGAHYREVFPLKKQKAGDELYCFDVPKGLALKRGTLIATASLGTAVICVGVKGSRERWRAAATLTTVNTPVDFGQGLDGAFDEMTKGEAVYVFVEDGELPASGSLIVDMEFVGV